MHGKRIVLPIACCVPVFCAAQHWAMKSSGLGNERFVDVRSGPGDVVFSTGEFGPGSTVAGQPLASQGLSDIFVLKQDAVGALQWVVRAGGPGLDLAGRVCPAPDGSVVVCGQFQGTADLFGTSITAQGGSTDLFVAKLAGSNGALLWVRTGGSAAYTDRAAGVAVGADGRVLLTGEFRGQAVFDAGTFNSTIDPGTSLPGSDVFVASYSADGTAQWLVQGIAERDDQAAGVAIGADGAAYAFGSYSETISFGTPHPNAALNQIYLVKLDAAGQEQWFRRIGGAAYQLPVDLRYGDNGSLYLCGDNQGALTWFGDTPQPISSTQPNAYFLIKAGTDGALQQATTTGSVNAVNATGLDQRGGTVAVHGTFQCAFGSLQQHYGANGIFIAVGTQDLFIVKYDAVSTAIAEAQQFGGHEEKEAGGITSLSNGELVFCGAFAEFLIFPSEGDGWGEVFDPPPCSPSASGPSSYCGDTHYTSYESILSAGGMDGFVARGYVDSREPYDPYVRSGNGCDRQVPEMMVLSMPGIITDSVAQCGGDTLFWQHDIHRYACPPCVCGPEWTTSWLIDDLAWSNGQDYFDTIHVWSSGWYWRTQTSTNGCYSETDSIHVEVLTYPGAWISVNGGPPFGPPGNFLQLCDDSLFTLEAVDVLPGETIQWYENGAPVAGTEFVLEGSGSYTLVVTGANGCIQQNTFTVSMLDSVSLPNITGTDFQFMYNGVPLDVQDTVNVCAPGTCMAGDLIPTWYVDGVPTVLTHPIFVYYGTIDGCGFGTTYPDLAMDWDQWVQGEGWHPLHVRITLHIEGCADDTLAFEVFDSVYFHIAVPEVTPMEDVQLCIGDTLAVPIHCTGCTELEVSGPPGAFAVSAGQDTVWVWGLGLVSVIGTNTEGAFCKDVSYFQVSQAIPPSITVEPVVVCPGDTVLLWTSFPSDQYDWTGPAGPLTENNDSVLVTMPGAYYLTAYTDNGCALFNGPANVSQFGTPSLSMQPDNVLCPGETGILQIIGGGITAVEWNPPLSGGSLVQAIDTPGIYGCVVTACGMQHVLNAVVVGSSVSAEIDTGPFTICGGGSVLLDGPEGDYSYYWTPSGAVTEDLLVTSPGQHVLQVTDAFGCTALSDVATVILQEFTQPLQVPGDSLCAGDELLLAASGSGTITWYADEALTQVLATGGTYNGGAQTAGSTLYVTQTEGGCTGSAVAVTVIVVPDAGAAVITGDTSLCEGEDLLLTAAAQGASGYSWTTPQGSTTGQQYVLNGMAPGGAGMYICVPDNAGCAGGADSVAVVVQVSPGAPVISGTTALCVGDPLTLTVAGAGTFTWYGPGGTGQGSVFSTMATAANTGTWTVTVEGGECPDAQAGIDVTVDDCGFIIPNVFTPNSDGQNDQFIVEGGAATAFQLRLFNRWGQEVRFMQATHRLAWDGRDEGHRMLSDGVYYYELMETRSGQTIPHTGYIQLNRGR